VGVPKLCAIWIKLRGTFDTAVCVLITVGKNTPNAMVATLEGRGSATESAALLDVCARLKLLSESGHKAGKEMLVRLVSMLVKLAQSLEE
jgi:hypothetical protein